jgi:hypothetical protein
VVNLVIEVNALSFASQGKRKKKKFAHSCAEQALMEGKLQK